MIFSWLQRDSIDKSRKECRVYWEKRGREMLAHDLKIYEARQRAMKKLISKRKAAFPWKFRTMRKRRLR